MESVEFEGEMVDGNRIVVKRFIGDLDKVMLMGDEAVVSLHVKVTGINHQINQRTGALTRIHEVKVLGVENE